MAHTAASVDVTCCVSQHTNIIPGVCFVVCACNTGVPATLVRSLLQGTILTLGAVYKRCEGAPD